MAMEVFVIAAVTLDGYIARFAGERSFDWTTEEDKKEYIAKIRESRHLVMGSNTLQTVKRFPLETTVYVYTHNPEGFSAEGRSKAATYQPTSESPIELVTRLKNAGVEKVAIVGGASIYSLFLAAGVVTKLYITIEPILFGKGIRLFAEHTLEQRLRLVEQRVLNEHGSVWLEYDVLPVGSMSSET